jgi:regulator of protease activity HflC (stomatin/prohibitin superfamily)|nr:SPFH domain-containing protein [Kofleriaceae bacterium]
MGTPNWGFVSAEPSEYLVCVRGGRVDMGRSGQGARVFKWPSTQIAIVPTTLQRIEFTADQITRERVGVQVSGLAVFRIAEPLLAYRVLDLSTADARAQLATTMREMFVGAARRLIANLTLDDCLSRRKEAIAAYLMDEIAPVVGGSGRPDDTTTRGWGIVLDTIEIQRVEILSEQVFAHLQAPFRADLAARAELAELERKRTTEEAQLHAQRATRELAARAEAEATEVESREAARRADMTAQAKIASIDAERARAEAGHRAATAAAQHARELAARHQEAEHALRQREAGVAHELQRAAADAKEHDAVLDAQAQRRLAEIEQSMAQARALRDLVTVALPQIAKALHQDIGSVTYTSIGGGSGGGPLDAVPAALAQLLAIARGFGLAVPESLAAKLSE